MHLEPFVPFGKGHHENGFIASPIPILIWTILHVQEDNFLNSLVYDDPRQSTGQLVQYDGLSTIVRHLHFIGKVQNKNNEN